MASQQYEEGNGPKNVVQVRKGKYGKNGGKHGERSSVCNGSTVQRYGSPKSTLQVNEARKGGVPVKTQEQNAWAVTIWRDWATYRSNILPTEEEEVQHDLKEEFSEMSMSAMNFWLCKFVLEVRRKDTKPYSPDTLYQICCGLLRLLKQADRAEVNILTDPAFHQFRETLDARMKELKCSGMYQPKRAEVISIEDENLLWDKNLLGDSTPEQLINTMVFYIGLFFSLRSGSEHRRL